MIIADITKNRTLFFILLVFLAIISALTSDLYLPAMPRIAETYQVGHDLIELTITIYMMGLTIGLFIYGNLLDVIGRKPVLIAGSSIYVFGTILCMMSSNLTMLLIGRFIQALGASCAIVSWQSIAADVYKKDAPHYMPVLFGLLAVSPSLGPIIGGLITTYYGWHSNFDAMFILSIVFFVCVVFFLPETGTRKRESEVSHLVKVVQSNKKLLRDPKFVSLGLLPGLNQGNFYAYVTASAFIFHNLGFTSKQIGFFYIPPALCYLTTSIISRKIYKKVECLKPMMIAGSTLNVIATSLFFYFAITNDLNIYKVLISISLSFIGFGLYSPISNVKAVTLHQGLSGAASSLIGVFGMFCGFMGSGIVAYLSNTPSVSYAYVFMIDIILTIIVISIFLAISRRKKRLNNLT